MSSKFIYFNDNIHTMLIKAIYGQGPNDTHRYDYEFRIDDEPYIMLSEGDMRKIVDFYHNNNTIEG